MKESSLNKHNELLVLLGVLKAALHKNETFLCTNVVWSEIHDELRSHAVSELVGDMLIMMDLDVALLEKWKNEIISRVHCNSRLLVEQDRIIRLLSEASIQSVVLKGSAAAIYYPKPEYRAIGDIDILVKPQDYSRALSLLEQAGYAFLKKRTEMEKHDTLVKSGVVFEIHRQFAYMNDTAEANILDTLLFNAIECAEKHQREGMVFYTLPPLENGLVLLHHISQHMEEGVGLRQMIDWMMYVNSVLDDDVWNCSFRNIAKQIGLEKLAIVVTRMCQLYLGLTEQKRQWCLCADRSLCDALMLEVFDNGDLGKKRKQFDSRIITVRSRSYNPFSLLAHLQRVGLANWQRAQENTWCRPFAWAYQMGVYARQLLAKRMTISDVRRGLKKGRERAELLETLGVFRLRDGVAVRTENDYTKKKF